MQFARISSLLAALTIMASVCGFNGNIVLAKELPSDVCSLLAQESLEKNLGQTFDAPKKSTAPAAFSGQPAGTQCEYSSKDGRAIKVVFISYVDPSATQAKQTFDRLSAFYSPKSKPAVGDSAYIDSNGAIHVLKGRIRYYIAIEPEGTSKFAPFLSWALKGHSSSGTPAQDKQMEHLAASVAAKI